MTTGDPHSHDDLPRRDAMAQLVHDLRQPLSTLRLLVDNAQTLELTDDATTVMLAIARQLDEAIAVARQMNRLVE